MQLKVDLAAKLARVDGHRPPRTVATGNGRDVMVVRVPGELLVVPRGLEHQPFAAEETHLLLIEPTGIPNTGDPRTAASRRLV